MNPESILVAWSGGKDSALALHALRADPGVRVEGLLTTVTADHDRVSMHGVRRALLRRQADAVGLPLHVVEIPAAVDNRGYDAAMAAALADARARGVEAVAFGDLFLEEIRAYREARLADAGMRAVFPLWGRGTRALAREFLDLGFRAVAVCVDGEALDGAFVGRRYDAAFLDDLPPGVDPCGENGEFHTFVYDGPGFAAPVEHEAGEVVLRDGRFWYRDLRPPPGRDWRDAARSP